MKHPQHSRPLVAGLVGATLAPAIGVLAYSMAAAQALPSSANDWWGVSLLLLIVGVFSLAGVLVLGLPYVLWLRGRVWLSWLNVIVGAAVAGMLHLTAIGWLFSWDRQLPALLDLWPGVVLGALSGLGFCVGSWPNNSFKPTPLRGAA